MCPKCNKKNFVKDGIVHGKQRYKCKNCSYRTIFSMKNYFSNKSIKRKALQLYLEGLGFRSISRILNYSHVSVYNWIKSLGKRIKEIQNQDSLPKQVEIDEMHTYVQKKMRSGYGYLFIELEKSSLILLSEKETAKQDLNYGKERIMSQ